MGQQLTTHPAEVELQGVLHALDASKGAPSADVLKQIRTYTRSALDLIRNPDSDPFLRRMHFVCAALWESTTVTQHIVEHGRLVTEVKVTDADLYEWAITQVHLLASGHVPSANGSN